MSRSEPAKDLLLEPVGCRLRAITESERSRGSNRQPQGQDSARQTTVAPHQVPHDCVLISESKRTQPGVRCVPVFQSVLVLPKPTPVKFDFHTQISRSRRKGRKRKTSFLSQKALLWGLAWRSPTYLHVRGFLFTGFSFFLFFVFFLWLYFHLDCLLLLV